MCPETENEQIPSEHSEGGLDYIPPFGTDVALAMGGTSSVAAGLLLIIVALLIDCLIMLHAVLGAVLVAIGVFQIAVLLGVMGRRRGARQTAALRSPPASSEE